MTKMAKSPKATGAQLLHRACDILDHVAASDTGISHADMASAMGLSRATTYRILAVLIQRGLVRHRPATGTYSLGSRFLEAPSHDGGSTLLRVAQSELVRLRDTVGETSYLAVLEGRDVVSVGKFEGPHTTRSSAELGTRKPLYCTSQGKAILSALGDAERAAILRRIRLDPLTPRTIVDRRRLSAELSIIRAKGFAIDDEEIALGVRCVGAPIIDGLGTVLGAVSIAGPAWRLSLERLHMLGPEVASVAQLIGSQVRSSPALATVGLDRYHFELLAPRAPRAYRGLVPQYHAASGDLWHADGLAPKVRRLTADGVDDAIVTFEEALAGIALTEASGLLRVVTLSGRLHLCGEDGNVVATHSIALPLGCDEVHATARFRDDKILIAAFDRQAATSTIGAMDDFGRLEMLFRVSGGVASLHWSAANDVVYAASALGGAIYRWSPQGGQRLVARLPAGSGQPSSIATDRQERVWVALENGWALARLNPVGDIDLLVPLPVPAPSGIAFDGPDGGHLLVATSRHGVSLEALEAAPLSGSLLRLVAPP